MKLSDINPTEVKPLEAPQQAAAPLKLSDINPDDIQFAAEPANYGEQAKAGAEAIARGLTLGGSDVAETQLGISSPENVKERMEHYPGTALAGNVFGNIGLVGLTGGVAAPIEAGIGGLAGRAVGYGVEGAALGAGNAVTDAALGDPNLNAQKVLTHIGLGAAIGAGLGVLSKGVEALPSLWRSAKNVAPDAGGPGAGGPGAEEAVTDAPTMAPKASAEPTPTTFDAMAERVAKAKADGNALELPQKGVLSDAMSRVEMENPVHPLQMSSLDSQAARDLYKIAMEMPGKEGDAIRGYEALQKQELAGKTDQAIEALSPDAKPTADAVKGGERAIDAFTEEYQATKKALVPVFQAIKTAENLSGAGIDHLPGVIKAFTDKIPGIARMFDAEASDLSILPYKSSWGIDKSTYNAVKEAVEALTENSGSFEDLMNIRGNLGQHVNLMSEGTGPGQIRALKAAMMDYVQGALDRGGYSIELRNAFRDYAINEQERQVIERAFGASVGSQEFGALSKIRPEMIGDKIFGNTANVKAAKAVLPKEKFNEILANWLSEAKAAATDKGAFSSNKFGSFLRRNQDALREAFSDNPAGLQRLQDLTTIMRILPDSASVNPSGTAKTLWGMLSKLGSAIAHPTEIPGKFFHGVGEKLEQRQIRQQLSAELAGKADQAAKIKVIQGMSDKVGETIGTGARSIFSNVPLKSGANSGLNKVASSDYKANSARIQELASNPQMMMDHLAENTDALAQAAPNITQGIHTTMMTAVNFLNSKIPRPSNQFFLSPTWQPSETQKAQFNQYFQAVDDPTSVFRQIKRGMLTSPTMEAINVVHPQLLQEMKQKVMEHMTTSKADELDYGTKLSLSRFLGMPLDENMVPAAVIANQATFTGPQLSQENPQGGGRKQPLGPMKNIKLASRVTTRPSQEQEET